MLSEAFLLEFLVAHRQHFVHDENLRSQVRRHGERQAHVHAAGITFDRRVEEPFHLRQTPLSRRTFSHLRRRHPENRAVQKNVLRPVSS